MNLFRNHSTPATHTAGGLSKLSSSPSPLTCQPSHANPPPCADILRQLEKVVSDFMAQYPGHTHRIPVVQRGEHPLIAFVRTMVASMASKEKQLNELNEQVRQVALDKERLLATMSHEVRTPMNGIFGLINLLLEMDPGPAEKEHLETMLGASESLLNILDDVLDQTKLNAREVQIRPRPFSLRKLIRDCLSVYLGMAGRKDLELTASVCDSLPDRFIADDLRIRQIIANLVSNAIKFTDHGSVRLNVYPISRKGSKHLLFEVTDTGKGIDPENGQQLFTPYRQIEGDSPSPIQGSGLGLSICKSLVELMEGHIWFESQVDVGSVFSFCVPIEIDTNSGYTPAPPPSQGRLEQERTSPSSSTEKLNVLLVEDNAVNQKVVCLTLKHLNCQVDIAHDGREAVELASRHHFGLILMDVNLPVMNGLDATRKIRQLDHPNAHTNIVAMTGMAFDEDRVNCLEAGMDDVLTKPFGIETLRQITANALERQSVADGVALSS